ncbi:unnamed protein product [Choristocarpus tenellus]
MGSASKGKDTKRAAFDHAATRHVEVAKAAQGGMGVDRHLLAMRSAAAGTAGKSGNAGGKDLGVEFFEDPLNSYSSTWLLSTSNLSLPWVKQFG